VASGSRSIARAHVSACSSALGHHAKALRFDTEARVELRAEILEGDRGGQLDDLRLGEMLLYLGEQRIVDLPVGMGDGFGVFERDALGLAEQLAVAPAQQLAEL